MSLPKDPKSPDSGGYISNRAGNLPSTEFFGLILREYVNIERRIAGVWTQIAENVAATIELERLYIRYLLATWTHKPLASLWLMPTYTIADGDRITRSDGSHWYVRGMPTSTPAGSHIVALVEGAAEDGLFATINPAEPAP